MEQETGKLTPQQVAEKMLEHDGFSKLLGLQIDEVSAGYCRLHFIVRPDMVNGFSIIHGGVVFSASDSAFAFACNSHGRITVALDVSITFIRPASIGETLFVEAKEIHLGHRTGVYDIRTTNEKGELIAMFKGTAYRTSKAVI